MDRTVKQSPKIMSLVKGLIAAYLITGILLLILALFLFKMHLDEGKVTLGIIIIYIVSCFFGGLFVGKRQDSRSSYGELYWGSSIFCC